MINSSFQCKDLKNSQISDKIKVFFKVRNNNITSIWTKEEDALLLKVKNSNKYMTWSKLSKLFTNKSPKQCNYRYRKLVNNPFNNNKSNILEIVDNCNEDFNKIISYFPNSQESDLEYYYFHHIKPKVFCFTKDESDIINSLMNFKTLTKKNMHYIESTGYSIIKKRLELIFKSKGKDYKVFLKLFEETYSRLIVNNISEYNIEEEKIEMMRLSQAELTNFSSFSNSNSNLKYDFEEKSSPGPIEKIRELFNYYKTLSESYFSNINIIADNSNQNTCIYEELLDREKLLIDKFVITNEINVATHIFNQMIEINKVKVVCLKSLIIYNQN